MNNETIMFLIKSVEVQSECLTKIGEYFIENIASDAAQDMSEIFGAFNKKMIEVNKIGSESLDETK